MNSTTRWKVFSTVLIKRKTSPSFGEVPPDFRMWTPKPTVLRKAREKHATKREGGETKKYPRWWLEERRPSQIRNLAKANFARLGTSNPQRYVRA